jgi:hypothetical protein
VSPSDGVGEISAEELLNLVKTQGEFGVAKLAITP